MRLMKIHENVGNYFVVVVGVLYENNMLKAFLKKKLMKNIKIIDEKIKNIKINY